MKVVLSYSGGVSRGEYLAENFAADNGLLCFYQPRISNLTKKLIPRQLWRESPATYFSHRVISLLNWVTKRKPSKRYLNSKITDKLVARQIKLGGNIFIGESGISLESFNRAKKLGYITILDRTNTHILHQNQIWGEELRKYGIYWKPSSKRVTDVHLAEYEAADYILVLSSFARKTFLENGIKPEKVILLPSGINTRVFKPCEVTKNPRQVIFCGGISLKKGAHHLMEAALNVQSFGVEVIFLGSISAEMRSIMNNKSNNVKIMPFVQRDELPRIYSGATCFVLPSLEEGLPKVTLEAMACGLPVITTANAAGEDLVEEGRTGFIISTGDVDLLSKKILWMAEHPNEAHEMGKRALAKVEQVFTDKKYYQRLQDALSKICKSA